MINIKQINFFNLSILIVCSLTFCFFPEFAMASVESSLNAIQQKFIGTILPVLAVIGLLIAGFSFLMGSANARSHLMLAILGAVIGFGAPSIVGFISGLVH
ncbi:MAG: TrbC/VirB2 family protein [Bdellovibrionaceae bacterium]|jgi:type IV secretory pathway VirB2 component (pilin)|nr:TrbC/VirB2 family protein [Pseudobdellovibrionaceae bacterium]